MKNPYEILGVSRDATKQEIIRGKVAAMKLNKYSLQEIQLAEKQLLIPAKRLVADFMFPTKLKAKRPKLIKIDSRPEDIDLSSVNENAFNSIT